ncbi:lipopolysaccharide biosynthesis protein [Sphingobacterium sp. SYP-B4668]|uniref:lipopolysaccharide biosynthesis protein n=1 Tax=Sphingobacterium sp. SYP-B4668 TaxID=2996035 RepID=UPI0022DD3A8D|nr:lipopolysaccharide biosynthesis protein [Sphingobacterium sp. SYP-B4668]
MSTKKSAISGIFWTLIDALLIKGVGFVTTLILTDLLSPDDYGLIGMIIVFVLVGNSFVESGMTASLIRTKNADSADYSTVFFLSLFSAIVIYAILFFAAPLVSTFYDKDILTPILRWYGLTFIISAFSSVQLTMMTAKMEFKKITKLNIPGAVLGAIVGITMGYLGYGVWSLAAMFLVTQVVQTIFFWSFSDWHPNLIFSKEKAKFHYIFGYKLMLSGLLNTVFNNIYNIIIGKFYSITLLGYFERSRTFNEYPTNIITSIVSKVTYPLLANIKNNREELSNAYQKILGLSFFITAPLMFGLAAVAHPLFQLLFNDKWLPAVPYFQIISLASMFYPIHSINLNVLKVFGRTDLFLKLEVIKKIITVVVIVLSIPFGVMGLVWSSVILSVIALLINTHYSASMIGYSTQRQLLDMLPTLVLSALLYGLVSLTIYFLSDSPLILQILVSFILAITFYVGANFAFKTPSFMFALKLVKEYKP